MIHNKSDPLTNVTNAVRFFTNFVLAEAGAGEVANIVAYLQNLMSHLLKGSISKDLKSKRLLVPSAGVIKISGHKFLCLSPLKEAQLIKNSSNFALILNYATIISLGIILENWKSFIKFFHPTENSANFPVELRETLNSLVRSILLQAMEHIPSVISKSKRLGETKNSSFIKRQNKIGVKGPNNL